MTLRRLLSVRHWMRRNLLVRLWVAIILTIVVATAVSTYLSIRSLRADAEQELLARLDSLAGVLSKSLARPLFDINTLAIASVAGTVGMDPEVLNLRVLATDGTVLAESRHPTPPTGRAVSTTRDVQYQAEGRIFDVGRIEVQLSAAAIEAKLRWQVAQAALSGVVLALAISISLALVSRRATRPFADVMQALERLAQGDTHIRLSGLGRQDEIGSLSAAVDRFRRTLEELHRAEQNSVRLLHEKTTMADRLQAIYQGSSDAIMLLTAGGFFDCNPRTLEMFGIGSVAEFAACHPSTLSPPQQPDGRSSEIAANERIAEAFAHGHCRFEWQHMRTDGSEFPAEVQLTAFEYDGRKVLQATVRDISERKRYEQALHELNSDLEARIEARTREIKATSTALDESRHKLQAIVDTALDAVVRIDSHGAIIGWNAQAEVIFGWPSSEAMGKHLDETIIPEPFREAHRQGMARYMASGVATVIDKRIEITALRRDGGEFPIELAITRVALHDDDQFEFCAFIRDISERKRAEEGLRQSLEKQRELNQLKARFITMASHEFRTPLATILSSTELLQHYLDRLAPQERTDLFATIGQAVRRMTHMLEDILVIGKDEADRTELKPAPIVIEAFFQNLIDEAGASARALGLEVPAIHLSLAGEPRHGSYDERTLHHIFGNLLSNAIKYSSVDSVVDVTIDCRAKGFVAQVRDQGIGIPEQDLPQLFDSFHRATNVGSIPGTGLGLSIVKRSVLLHGGRIEVDSAVGKGTSFTVHLPQLDAAGLPQAIA